MEPDLAFGLSLGVVFAAALVRSTFGFGDALLAMPLLALTVGTRVASPVMAVVALALGVALLVRHRGRVRWGAALSLILPTLAGIPVGLYLLSSLAEREAKTALGVVVVGFAAYNLLRPEGLRLRDGRWAFAFGVVAGVFGGAYNTNGPFVVFYAALRRWAAEDYRGTLQAYFVTTGAVVVAGHTVAGNVTAEVLRLAGAAVVPAAIAFVLGGWVARALTPERFAAWVYRLLGLLGIVLLATTWR
jgi:hypothetical protein